MAQQKKSFRNGLRKMVGRFVSGKTSEAENRFLHAYYDHFEKEPDILDKLSPEEKDRLEKQMETNIMTSRQSAKVLRLPGYLKIAAAAVITGVLVVTGVYLSRKTEPQPVAVVQKKALQHDIAPGGNKAILTLADGNKVNLDDSSNSGLLEQNNSLVSAGKIIYNQDRTVGKESAANSFNMLQTPTGGEYQVVLSDGTKVWLNASSSIRFPTTFFGSERIVELTGEGYFEVAKNASKPFIVHVNDMNVRVLGTHFNIMAYSNESLIKTTLLEGSVMVSKGTHESLLVPGQQALIGTGDAIRVQEADVAKEVSWKNGYFTFNRDNIRSVMRQLSRWYDMDVNFEGKESTDEFSGKIRRTATVAEALRILQLTDVQFKIEGKKVTIKQ